MKKNKGYKVTKKIGKIVRNKVSVLPKNKHNNLVISLIYKPLEYLVKSVLQIGAFGLCGLYYKKGKDSPTKGSVLYTLFYILLALLSVKLLGDFFASL